MWPQINNNIIDRVSEVLKSGKLNQWNNNLVTDFENKFSEKMDCKYGVAVFNGTVALELCLKSLELNEGDEVIISYLEHHANIVPWHIAAKKYKFKLIPYIPIDIVNIIWPQYYLSSTV